MDEHKQALPGATLTVIHEATGYARSTTSDARGNFFITTLPPGSYTIRAELANFRTEERTRQVLNATSRLSLPPFRLQVGLGESIVVEGGGSAISTEDSQHTGLITSKQIEQIQVKGRDVTTLMRLVPGVRYEDTTESLGESFGTLVPHVGGQRRDWNTIMVDGVLGNEVGQTNRMAQQINLDAVDEIKVLLNTYRAEYGRGGGAPGQAAASASSKSGAWWSKQASKPSSPVTKSHLCSDPAMPTTRQPLILAIWPTTEPTGPDAAATTRVSPGFGLAISRRPTYAVWPGMPSTPSAVEIGAMSGSTLRASPSPNRA
jgi:hypothetical protein